MSADVCAQLLIQKYIQKLGMSDQRVVVLNDPGRYYEHAWAKKYSADAAFAFSSRSNTTEEMFDPNDQWSILKQELSAGSFIILQTDIAANDEEFDLSAILSETTLTKINSLTIEEQKRIVFVIDTTLYPTVQLNKLFDLLPKASLVIATSSLNKFHQLGFDIGGFGAIAVKAMNEHRINLSSFLTFSGLTPAPRELGLLQLLLEPRLVFERMNIIRENTETMMQIFKSKNIQSASIAIDPRLAYPEEIGGLISLPKLGVFGSEKVLQILHSRNIQIDIRTSFGHNTTSLEDVHGQEWSRISVGIEDKETIEIIANTIADVLQEDESPD